MATSTAVDFHVELATLDDAMRALAACELWVSIGRSLLRKVEDQEITEDTMLRTLRSALQLHIATLQNEHDGGGT